MEETQEKKYIYAHRGFWHKNLVQNSLESFIRASDKGFGVETDVRLFQDTLIISHDNEKSKNNLKFQDLLNLDTAFALNIKEDGMGPYLHKIVDQLPKDSFFFDGSIPEMVKLRSIGLETALRISEIEKDLPWKTNFIWLDSFFEDWWVGNREILGHLENGTKIIAVSPELHGREKGFIWDSIVELRAKGFHNLGVCTDFPLEFFNHESSSSYGK